MKTLTIQIPDNFDEKEVKVLLAGVLYEKGLLSLGQAAEQVGVSKRDFMELLGKHDISIFNYSEAELTKEILNAKNYHR